MPRCCWPARAADRYAGGASVGAAALVALASVPLAFPPGGVRAAVATPFLLGSDLGLAVDGLAAPVLPVVALVSLLVLVSAGGSPDLRTARFHGLMLLFVAAALMTVLATSLPALLLSWEVMGATSYALIGYHWRDPAAVASGTTAFLTTRAADLGLYVAAGAALAGGAGLGLSTLAETSAGWRHVLAAGLLVAGLGKAAQLPFSFWLSRAMHGPSPVSALLHSAAMVAMGGYLLLRVSPTLAATGWADDATAWAGALTAVLLGLVALAQRDLKQLLAASTAAQLGYVVLAAGVGATAAGTMHLVAHAAVKAGLFLAAGLWLEALGTQSALARSAGPRRRWPVVGACAAAGLVSLAGLPPFALWATKDAVLTGALEHSPLLYATGLVGAALAAAYAGKALVVLLRQARDGERDGGRGGLGRGAAGHPAGARPRRGGAGAAGRAAPSRSGCWPSRRWPAPLHDLVGGAAAEPGPVELLVSALVALTALGLTPCCWCGVDGSRPPPARPCSPTGCTWSGSRTGSWCTPPSGWPTCSPASTTGLLDPCRRRRRPRVAPGRPGPPRPSTRASSTASCDGWWPAPGASVACCSARRPGSSTSTTCRRWSSWPSPSSSSCVVR